MLKKLQVVFILLSMINYAVAGSVSIGTASARGDMRVDNYTVKSNATLFDGSVVETGQASANLRLNKGAEITMSTSSKGTLYSDRLVLQQGISELTSSGPFLVEADGLRVTPNEPNSRGVVSMSAGNIVQVAALNGSFGVTNGHGVQLASVRPGRALSFAIQAGGSSTSFEGVGLVSNENGHYYLTDEAGGKYELECKDVKKYNGEKVLVSGNMYSAKSVVCVNSIGVNDGTGMASHKGLIIGGVAIAAGVAIGFIVYDSISR